MLRNGFAAYRASLESDDSPSELRRTRHRENLLLDIICGATDELVELRRLRQLPWEECPCCAQVARTYHRPG